VRFKAPGKFGAMLLLAVLLLVQFSAVAPGLARAFHLQTAVCHCCGNHAMCGCSAEKIASRTCCCYLNKRKSVSSEKPSCCAQSDAVENHADDLDRSTPAYSSIPCGCDPHYSPVSVENLKFLKPYTLYAASVPVFTRRYLPLHLRCLTRYTDPPDPPPRLSLFS